MRNRYIRLLLVSFALFGKAEALSAFKTPRSAISPEVLSQEKKLIAMVNAERMKHHLQPLAEQEQISACARQHSHDMARNKVPFGHDGFNKRAELIMSFQKYNGCGENVAYTYLMKDPLLTAVEGWMLSPGHRENILGDFNETGMGIAYSKEGRCYMTQLFAKRIKK